MTFRRTLSVSIGTRGSGSSNHAFRWDGETGAGFDLHSLLPTGVYGNSGAEAIDSAGNIIGWAQRTSGYLEAVLWRVVSTTPNSMPEVSLLTPRPYSRHIVSSFIELSAQAVDPDGSIATVEFLANGELVGSGSLTKGSSYGMVWKANRAGTYRIQARATDNLGAVSYSRPSIIYLLSGIGN